MLLIDSGSQEEEEDEQEQEQEQEQQQQSQSLTADKVQTGHPCLHTGTEAIDMRT